MAEHRSAVVLILEAYVAKFNLALRDLKLLRVRLVGDLNRRVHDLEETLDSGHAALELLGEFDDPADRCDKGRNVKHISYKIAGGDTAVDHEKSAAENDDKIHKSVEKAGRSLKQRHESVRCFLDRFKFVVSPGEFFLFRFFGGKCLYDALAEKTVLDLRVQLADLHALTAERIAHTVIEHSRNESHKRHAQEDHDGQRDIVGAQDYKAYRDLKERNEEFLGAVVRKLGHFEKIVRYAPHYLTDLGVRIIVVPEKLKMRESVLAHLRFYVDAHYMTHVSHVILRRRVDDAQHEVKKGHLQYKRYRERRKIGRRGVCDRPQNKRQDEIAKTGERCTEQIDRNRLSVRLHVGKKATKKPFLPFFLFF